MCDFCRDYICKFVLNHFTILKIKGYVGHFVNVYSLVFGSTDNGQQSTDLGFDC